MSCLLCHRPARGFRCADSRFAIGDARRYPIAWVFCSQRCQRAFSAQYRAAIATGLAHNASSSPEVLMWNARELEQDCLRRCLRPLGEVASDIGFDKPLGHYSEAEALRLITAIVQYYVEALTLAHEHTSVPCVRVRRQTQRIDEESLGETPCA